MANDEDMILLGQWREGDRKAGDTLISKHYAYALRLAKRRLSNEADAVEATQHAMTILVRKQDVIEDGFRQYLSRVVYFSVLTQSKRRQPEPFAGDEPGVEPTRGAATLLAQKEEVKLIIKAMRSLKIDDQLLLYYDHVGEKTRGEIAEVLGIPMTSIYTRVNKAKERVRKRLETFRDSPVRQSTLGGLETWLKSMHGKAP